MTNRAFEDLEKRCRASNRKIFLRWFLFSTVILFSIFVSVFKIYFGEKDAAHIKQVKKVEANVSMSKPVANKLTTVNKKVDGNQTIIKTDTNKSISNLETYKTILLKPNIVMPKIKQKVEEVNTTTKKKENLTKVVAAKKIKNTVVDKNQTQSKKDKIQISIKTMPNEQSLIETNGKDEDFDSALKLAQYYYTNQKYEKAIFYSKRANHYNPSSAKPWLVYARAKIKENRKEDAIKALETYLAYFNSDDAENLLISLKGKR